MSLRIIEVRKCTECPNNPKSWGVCKKTQRAIHDDLYDIPPDCPLEDPTTIDWAAEVRV